jgi:hypothetical protein
VFDEAYPAHISREVVDLADAVRRLPAGREARQVETTALRVRVNLEPLAERFLVDRADGTPLFEQSTNEMAADETSSAGDQHILGLCHLANLHN